MAFRPTIAVVIDRKIAYIGYYRNWATEDLFIEALGFAVLFRDVRTIEEFRERFFGTQKIYYRVDPEAFENTQENLCFLEECSEMPISVDLTRRAIYEGYSDANDEYVFGKPGIEDVLIPRTITEKFYWDLLTKHRISFDEVDMDSAAELFMNDEELSDHLSVTVSNLMEKTRSTVS